MSRKIYLCSPKQYEGAISLPMIEFKRVLNSIDLSRYDTLMFTSKQAIYFTEEINKSWRDKYILAVGAVTAKVAKELGAKEIYHPKEFYGETLANDIVKNFKDRKILYIRPKIISFDSKNFLKKYDINIEEKILYETLCVNYNNKYLEKESIIIFTSPSTIECFFKNFEWDSSFRAVVIGKSTLSKLPNKINAYVANEATISSCIEKAIDIAKI